MTESPPGVLSTDSRQSQRRRCGRTSPTPLAIRELESLERRNHAAREALVRRVRSECDEMHGLQITLRQAGRLFGLREDVCARILGALRQEGVLVQLSDGQYRRKGIG